MQFRFNIFMGKEMDSNVLLSMFLTSKIFRLLVTIFSTNINQ